MSLLQLIYCAILLVWTVNGENNFNAKESVRCEVSIKDQTKNESSVTVEHAIRKTLKCDLNNSSGITYNNIDVHLAQFYSFYVDKDDFEVIENMRNSSKYDPANVEYVQFLEIRMENGEWQFLPNGFDSTFPKLNSLTVTNCGLTILDKQNMQQFSGFLISANFSKNLLIFLTDDLFEYNGNLKQCDFSNNPIVHIPSTFFDNARYRENKMIFFFENVDCIDKVSVKFFISSNDEQTNDCANPASVISYNDLKNHLKRDQEECELFCSITTVCQSIEKLSEGENSMINQQRTQENIRYTCNMSIVNPRTFLSNKIKIIDDEIDANCDELSTDITLDFHPISYIEYMPMRVADIFKLRIKTLIIIKSGLISVNEYDMKQFGDHIKFVDFSFNKLESLGKNVFRHNRNLQSVKLIGNPISYLDLQFNIEKYSPILLIRSLHNCGHLT